MGPTPSSDDRDGDHDRGHGRDACGVPLRAVTALTAVVKVVTPERRGDGRSHRADAPKQCDRAAKCQYRTFDSVSQEGRALGARAMAYMSRKEIPRCRTSSQRTIRTHLTLPNRVSRPTAASCG